MGIKLVKMEKSDIERNPIITTLLDIYNISNIKDNKKKNNTLESVNNKQEKNKINQDAALIPIEHYISK
jgi:hypothetical protein